MASLLETGRTISRPMCQTVMETLKMLLQVMHSAKRSRAYASSLQIARDFAAKPHINVTPTTLVSDGSPDASSHSNQVKPAKTSDATAMHSPVPSDRAATPISARKIRLKVVGPQLTGNGIPLSASQAGKDSSPSQREGVKSVMEERPGRPVSSKSDRHRG